MTTPALGSRRLSAVGCKEQTEARSSAGIADEEVAHLEQIVRPRPGMTAVDLACGTGQWTRRLAALGLIVTGFDSCDEDLAKAQAAGPYPGLSYIRWDIVADPIPGELAPAQFDLVTCRYGLPSLEPGRILTDVGRWLKPEGIFYALVRVDAAHGPAGGHTQTHPGDQLAEVSSFPKDVSDEYVRHLGVGWAYRTVHELGLHRRVIVLSEYGVDAEKCPSPQAGRTRPEHFQSDLRRDLCLAPPTSQVPAQNLSPSNGDHL
ncbi:class I SAM-dependent methyltransferase [Streptomyces sp. NPDC094149]|uniref:class I SAM-dependent methyltransferase n=1 Tax=Streptomyces sp. NPDC094149 TaxID=3155079 RepID=UPI00331A366F